MAEPKFFATQAQLRKWFEKNYRKAAELHVGLYKKGAGKPSINWSQLVDEALCFGWIDGRANSIDEESWMIRITPRRPGSIWSGVNIKKVEALKKQGLMKPEGLAAYDNRKENKSEVYAFEQGDIELDKNTLKKLKGNKKAWAYFSKQAPSYRKNVTWWLLSARQEATKQRRIEQLIESSLNEEYVKHLRRIPKK